MTLYIKNMVSLDCKLKVHKVFHQLKLAFINISIGYVHLADTLKNEDRILLKAALWEEGLELVEERRTCIISSIKCLIVDSVFQAREQPINNYSTFLSDRLNYSYAHLAKMFSEICGYTIEQFIITQRIEHAKQLILSNDFTLTEIAYMLDYSSVAHLSAQFKKVTGSTPTMFRTKKHDGCHKSRSFETKYWNHITTMDKIQWSFVLTKNQKP